METLKHYRVGKLAEILGVSTVTVRKWIKSGHLKGKKNPSGQLWVLEEDLTQFMAKVNEDSATENNKPYGVYNTSSPEE